MEADGLTKTGRVLGTTDYVSPEQAMGRDVDARSDIYSLGILLYEMLIGDVPFKAETLVGVAMKHVNEEMPDVQQRRPGRLGGAGLGGRARDPEGAEEALPGHGRDARRPRGRAGGRDRAVRRRHRRHDDRARLGPDSRSGCSARARSRSRASCWSWPACWSRWRWWSWAARASKRGADVREPGAPPSGGEIELARCEDFDPEGDDGEHSDEVDLALDGDPTARRGRPRPTRAPRSRWPTTARRASA